MDFKDKRVLVVGMARSGMAAAKALHQRGAMVTVCDRKGTEELKAAVHELQAGGIEVCTGYYPQVNPALFDLVVASPGIPLDIAPFAQAHATDVPVIGELELAYLIKPEPVEMYAVTGTNGKTTTVSLLQTIMAADGRNSIAAGNIGLPLTSVVDSMEEGVITVEVSSFQLQTIEGFRPRICSLLNITPDHLDRHKSMEAYTQTKASIFSRQLPDDYAVLNYEDPAIRELARNCPSQVIFFSVERVLSQGVSIRDNTITVADGHDIQAICPVGEVLLRGKHNLENILAAVGVAMAAGVRPEIIAGELRTFPGVRHRMEPVMVKKGVQYINDSKATNPDSAIKALQSFDEGLVLIAGGRNKGSSFKVLAELIREKVKTLVLLGEAREQLQQAVIEAGFKNIYVARDLEEAVRTASMAAVPGDVVLLSPACASWDMFDNYEQRGDLFCELVNQL